MHPRRDDLLTMRVYFAIQEGDLIMTGTPAGVGEMKPDDKITVGLTYPGLEGEEISKLEWDCVQREGGYEFSGK
jgi:acylpyruvate hydrolase